jgi:hypothetical protein
MAHYLMIGGDTACGATDVPAVRAKTLVSCPECLLRVNRWSDAHAAAKAAWAERIAKGDRWK